MAAYNAEQYIELAIESVLQQSFSDLELVIVNDGSTDQTLDVINKFAIQDNRIKVLSQENQGQTVAKNEGIRASSGDFIGFCDADDIWTKDKLRKQLNVFEQDLKVGVVYTDTASIDASGQFIKVRKAESKPEGKITEKLLMDNFIPFGTALVRSEVLESVGGFNTKYRMGIDWDLWLRVSLSWEFAYLQEQLYLYREWENQMSRNFKKRFDYSIMILQDFEAVNKGRLPKKLIRKALADIHATFAYHSVLYEGHSLQSFRHLIKAVLLGVDSVKTLRRVGRTLLKRF